jgi:hypothetical protein
VDPKRDDDSRDERSDRTDRKAADGSRSEATDDRRADADPPPDGTADDRPPTRKSEAPDEADDELEEEFDRRGEEQEGFPPPPDDGPLRVLPVRHLRLADDDRERSEPDRVDAPASPYRAGPPARAWQWVPLAALLALLTTTAVSALLTAALPESQEALRGVSEAVVGVEGDEAKLEAVQDILDGPQGRALVEALVGIIVAFVGGLLLAGLIVGLAGRAGAVEAGLGTGTFTLLSMLFVGGGLSVYTLPTPFIAFGLGWLGAKLGLLIRRRRAARRGR